MPPSNPRGGPSRATPAVLVVIAAALLVARVALGIWDTNNPESRPELMTWTAPSAAAEEARMSGRLVLYAFTDRKNIASRKLSSEVFADPELVQRLSREFVAVRIEGDPVNDTPGVAAMRAAAGVTITPALVITTADGAKSKLVVGFKNVRATMQALGAARMEVLGLPFSHRPGGGRSFRFQVGGNGAGDNSSEAEVDSLLRGR